MSKMISVASGFQYSVNIGFDLNNEDKLQNFIPTKSALELLEETLISTRPTSTDRARVLIGAYGKGKSHIMLMILSILQKKDLQLLSKMLPKIQENPRLLQAIENYYESDNKILPVVITGSNTSLSQAFLLALQRTLSENDMLDVMPETNYKAAATTIRRWQTEFPETYEKFAELIDVSPEIFVSRLEDYDSLAYEAFERTYPALTAGSVFNPFLGFDIIDLYESTVKGIRAKGYTGIYLVYDEFSKFLEANITNASVSDTKMLQDFAEKCNRSGEQQMHIMLISHKEISNYIDKLPKQKVDGWRGVSERFKHIHLNNNFSQTYEIIASVIQKNDTWATFCSKHEDQLCGIEQIYARHPLFTDLRETGFAQVLFGCFPLHPVSTFILPRLSEKVAQNERTLFTFLSAHGTSTLSAFLEGFKDDCFALITPDLIFDYFEPLLKKEIYDEQIHHTFVLTGIILDELEAGTLESKIIKTISLIYILGQFERLKPTSSELVNIYSCGYTPDEVGQAIQNLIDQKYLLYLKRSNDYLQLKQASGVNIRQKISDTVERQRLSLSIKDILNSVNFDNYIYPSRYNDEREMTRYFSFEFIAGREVTADVDWLKKSEDIEADGVVYGVLPESEELIPRINTNAMKTSSTNRQAIFVIPKHYRDIDSIVREYYAVKTLRDETGTADRILFDEYQVIYEDLLDVMMDFMGGYTRPESNKAIFIHNGNECHITRKAALTALMSDICFEVFGKTPIINNEVINRNDITSVTSNSRSKIISALLRAELEPNLGLSGSSQDVSIMRSTLMRTGILETDGITRINLNPTIEPLDNSKRIAHLMSTIEQFFMETQHAGTMGLDVLYDRLTSAAYGIGLRHGLIPVYLAVVLHVHRKDIILSDRFGQVSPSTDLLSQINANPKAYSASYIDWSPEKEAFIATLAALFAEYVVEEEKNSNPYDYVGNAMRRWYMDLPRFSREYKKQPSGDRITSRDQKAIGFLRQNSSGYQLLFEQLPGAYELPDDNIADLATYITETKEKYDVLLLSLRHELIQRTKSLFSITPVELKTRASLAAIIEDWTATLDPMVGEQLFPDGTHRLLELFANVPNDEETYIARLAKLATDLRLEDWDNSTLSLCMERLKAYKLTAEAFHTVATETSADESMTDIATGYQITFPTNDGRRVTKRFDQVQYGSRGKLLYNQITSALSSMGQALSEQEKRQIVVEILEKLC